MRCAVLLRHLVTFSPKNVGKVINRDPLAGYNNHSIASGFYMGDFLTVGFWLGARFTISVVSRSVATVGNAYASSGRWEKDSFQWKPGRMQAD